MEKINQQQKSGKIGAEADFFSRHNNELTRSNAWSSIPYFQNMLRENLNILSETKKVLGKREFVRCLALACGDMTGEYNFLKKIGAHEIDAFDISEGQREKFFKKVYDGKIKVNYNIGDVNNINLKEDYYDVVYVQESYHHIENVEHLAKEINKSLKSDGVFVIIDYIGEPFLQRTKKQREICSKIWKTLPKKYRKNPQGVILENIHIPKKEILSPNEAIRSDIILPTLKKTFIEHKTFLYAGILFPIFNNFAKNYENNESDMTLIKLMWELDRILVEEGTVEPNFIRGIFRKR